MTASQVDLLGRYGVVTADCPWPYEDSGTRAGVDHHYGTMSMLDIISMPVHELVADNAALFLWITNAHLLEGWGAKVSRAWGFDPKTVLTWDKQKMGVGKTFRGRTEHVIFAMRGRPVFPHHNLTTMLTGLPTAPSEFADGYVMDLPARSQKHSEKPAEFYSLVERCLPVGPYLELFARGAPRSNWHKWGNEVEGGGVRLPCLDRAR